MKPVKHIPEKHVERTNSNGRSHKRMCAKREEEKKLLTVVKDIKWQHRKWGKLNLIIQNVADVSKHTVEREQTTRRS